MIRYRYVSSKSGTYLSKDEHLEMLVECMKGRFKTMDLASTLYNRREELQMRKSDVTRQIGDVTHQAVKNWETGISIPTDAHLMQLSQILQLDLTMLQQMKAQALVDLDISRSEKKLGYKESETRNEFIPLLYLQPFNTSFSESETPNTVTTSESNDREPENVWSSITKSIKNLFGRR